MSRPSGPWGAWSSGLRLRDRDTATEAAAALEDAGYSALWMTAGISDPFSRVAALLDTTRHVTIALGILSIWEMPAAAVAARVDALPESNRSRLLLGLGVSHPMLVDRDDSGRYDRPLTRMTEFLDELDAFRSPGTDSGSRVLAALGPKMLELASRRSIGAHPYLTTIEHTAQARTVLGPESFLAPTQMVLLETDASRARDAARRYLSMYMRQPNYTNSWKRLGFADDDVAHGGSDRLIDELVFWGDADQVAEQLNGHLTAGADHVCVQMLDVNANWDDHALPLDDWRRLAAVLDI